jgi:hemerythrin superfamily protein
LVDLLAKDLPAHLEASIQPHMNFLLERLVEQQQVITTLYSKVNDLDKGQQANRQEITMVQSGLVAATIALKASETRHEKNLQDQMKSLDNKINKVNSNLHSEIRNEISKAFNNLNRK